MSALPPGPRSTAIATLQFMRDAPGYYARCLKRYGDPFTIPSLFGPLVITSRPDAMKAIFTAEPDTFQVFAVTLVEPLFGPSSLMITHGEGHRRDRRLLLPMFHSTRMGAYGQVMAEVVSRASAQWRPGTRVVMEHLMHDLSLEIILRAFFGASDANVQTLRDTIVATQRTVNGGMIFVPPLRREFGGFGPWARFRRAVEKLDALVYRIIQERRAASPGEDILSMLLAARYEDGNPMTDQEVRDQLLSFLHAGHETVTSAMSWAMYWLHRHPEALHRLRDELEGLGPEPDPEALAGSRYLEAACNETLRMSPILPEIARQVRRPFEFLGYQLPVGVGVSGVVTLVHFREDLYPQPTLFRPERFIERKYSPFEFITFGGGVRRCVGAPFALHEMKVVLGTLLRRFELRLERDAPVGPARHSLPVSPRGGVPMIVQSLRAPPAARPAASSSGG